MKGSELVNEIYLLVTGDDKFESLGCPTIKVDSLVSSNTVKAIAAHADTEYSLIYTKYTTLELGYFSLERFLFIADSSEASMVYADHYQVIDGVRKANPLITYQEGSLRDDFNFGSVLIYRSEILKKVIESTKEEYPFAGMYNLRLASSCLGPIS